MVALSVSAHLKSESIAEFTFVLQQGIHPSLKKIKGFKGHIVLVLPNAREAVAISLWDAEENEGAERDAVSKVPSALGSVIQGSPTIKVSDFPEKTSGDRELLQSLAEVMGEDGPLQILEVSRFVSQHFTMDSLV